MKLGFIGAGNMAGAIIKGVISSGFLSVEDMLAYDISASQCEKLEEQYHVRIATDNPALARACDAVILAVKPAYLGPALEEIKPHVRGKNIVSIAAGWTSARLAEALGAESGARILRVMPNFPAMVGEGYTALCAEHTLDEASFEWVRRLFETFGETRVFPERLFDAVTAVSGSGPGYVFLLIEAMADGAVQLGISREDAYQATAQAVLGAAKVVLETKGQPGKLKEDVCSPGGTTIAAINVLEKSGFRGAVFSAMDACAKRSREMGK